MLLRLLLFLLVFYIIYYLLRQLLIKPLRDGSKEQDPVKRYQQQKRRQEGSVTITYNPQKRNPTSEQDGEYVDYEEVKDDERKQSGTTDA